MSCRWFTDRARGCARVVRWSLVIAMLAGGGAALGKPAPKDARASEQGVVNINTATEQQLCFLPRIGPSKARAIITRRTRHPFRSDAELTRVKGIGRKTYRLLRAFVTLKGETTLTRKAKPESP